MIAIKITYIYCVLLYDGSHYFKLIICINPFIFYCLKCFLRWKVFLRFTEMKPRCRVEELPKNWELSRRAAFWNQEVWPRNPTCSPQTSMAFLLFHGTTSVTPVYASPLDAVTHYHRVSSVTQHESTVSVRRSGGQWAWRFSHPWLSRWRSRCQGACTVIREPEGQSAPKLICMLAESVPCGREQGPRSFSSCGLQGLLFSHQGSLESPSCFVSLLRPSIFSGFKCLWLFLLHLFCF